MSKQGQSFTKRISELETDLAAKNRELEIEAALEEVRSRSMAMQESDELKEVISVVLKKLEELGIAMEGRAAGIFTFKEGSKDHVEWVASPQHASPLSVPVPYFDHPIMKDFITIRKKGIELLNKVYSCDVKDSLFHYLYRLPELQHQPESEKKWVFGAKDYSMTAAFEKHSAVAIAGLPAKLPSENEITILKRFAKVFEQSYTRFLDLKKAEEQARQAQIEAALERVRARAMAMQKSDELREVIGLVYKELQGLGSKLVLAMIHTYNWKNPTEMDWWVSGFGKDVLPRSYHVPITPEIKDNAHFKRFFELQRKGVEYDVYNLSGKTKEIAGKYLFEKTEMKHLPPVVKESMLSLKSIFLNDAFMNCGVLDISSHEPLPDDEANIVKRFAKVIDLTFTRVKELQESEERAREVVKQASLDRIRGEIASMRTAEDLNRITPVVWRELTALSVPFIRCGVFIVDETSEKVRAFLTTPDGKPLGVLNLAFDVNELTSNIVIHWRKNRVYKEHWNKQAFINGTKSMMELGQVQNVETYQGSSTPPESLNLQFVPFTQGMLYVGNTSPLDEEKLELVKSLAEAFSIAYARYEDFKNLETAKAKVGTTLDQLKSTQHQLVQQEKLASLGQLTAGIAHEIKNPLNFVNNFSDLCLELVDEVREELSALDPQVSNAMEILKDIEGNLKKIYEHGTRADGIVRSMLQHSRGGSGNMEPVDINQLLKEYANLAFHGMRANKNPINVDIEMDLDDKAGKVPLITEEFSRVILNLCNNAFDAMRDKLAATKDQPSLNSGKEYEPKLIIRSKRAGKNLSIEIEDNGTGIPTKIKNNILQPFFTTKKGTEGTGLGLSITNDIIKAHGGTMSIESEENEYTKFIINLIEA